MTATHLSESLEDTTRTRRTERIGNPFQSFWMAGFECCDHQNASGYRVDFLEVTGHLDEIDADYARLEAFGIRTVREGIRWSRVEKSPYRYDWSDVRHIAKAADHHGIQIVWDLCHFGYPDDLTPLHPLFAKRFAHLCEAFARLQAELRPVLRPIIVPINEVSFISWLGGDVRGTCPYCTGQGWEVKYHLMKAFIEGVRRIRRILPEARIMITEPLVNVVPASEEPEAVATARQNCEYQFQAADILLGRICPELGGNPECLDIIGYNYYYTNQWEDGTGRLILWKDSIDEPLRLSLSQMIASAYDKYKKPFIIAETSHPREDRPEWMDMIGRNVVDMLRQGLPLLGVCIYPIIDRPDWDYLDRWHHAGLWDNPCPDPEPDAAAAADTANAAKGLHAAKTAFSGNPALVSGIGPMARPARVLCEPYAEALRRSQAAVAEVMEAMKINHSPDAKAHANAMRISHATSPAKEDKPALALHALRKHE